ncbi:MAG: hypothetical protein IJJ29_07400, partial [Solobacterium sp.]|nr:hypothetical protein [Solobacterium sp.]
KGILRDLIISYIWEFCDETNEKTKEVSMVKMLDKYGWDFDYVHWQYCYQGRRYRAGSDP